MKRVPKKVPMSPTDIALLLVQLGLALGDFFLHKKRRNKGIKSIRTQAVNIVTWPLAAHRYDN